MDKKCACVADDAQVCFRLRYPEPEDAEWDYNERCICPCHEEYERYYYEEEGERDS